MLAVVNPPAVLVKPTWHEQLAAVLALDAVFFAVALAGEFFAGFAIEFIAFEFLGATMAAGHRGASTSQNGTRSAVLSVALWAP